MAVRRRRRYRLGRCAAALIAGAVIALSGCSISQTLRPDTYTVRRGDTLYGIAQYYDISWHKLARWNQIAPPYRLKVGQRLTLKPYPPLDYAHMPKRGRRRVVRAPQDSSAEQKRSIETSVKQLNREIAAAKTGDASPNSSNESEPLANGAAEASLPAPKPTPDDQPRAEPTQSKSESISGSMPQPSSPTNDSKASTPPSTPARVAGPGGSQWQWPASGAIVQAYAPGKNRQGIEIGGAAGAAIYAASEGKVVYNGPGLKGFGDLIILKHRKDYLSAYGFVRDSGVKKGERVDIGQRIASMGEGPGQKARLHFEIRHDGEPLNPEKLLPAQP